MSPLHSRALGFISLLQWVKQAQGAQKLKELTCRVFGSLIQEGRVAKIADNLYCSGTSLDDLCNNWESLLKAASRNDLRLSASQTVVNPKTTGILGWVWSQSTIKASPHSICTLQSCELPSTVTKLRSFVGAYKVLSRVLPACAAMVAPFDSLAGNRPASEKVQWSDESIVAFKEAQKYLSKACTITMPRRSDKLWIVLDATTKSPAVGATLYIDRGNNNSFKVAGFFSAKVKGHQIDWLPCEREALAIASAIKYFQPFIVQSDHQVVVLTDNKPCVQAFAKLQKGEFSASPRVSTFLSTCHRFQVTVQHISGVDNLLSDHQSRNPIDCVDSSCQICRFITDIESSVVREISVQDVISGMQRLPFLILTSMPFLS